MKYHSDKASEPTLKLALLLIGLLATTCPAALADDPSAQSISVATPDAQTSTATQGQAPPQPTTLSGSVQKITSDLDHLNDVGRDLKNCVKSLSSLYDEASYQPATFTSETEMVGPTVLMFPTLVKPLGMPPQPMRKERVDLAMSQIKPVIDMLQKNVNRYVAGQVKIDLPVDTMAQVQPLLDQWVNSVNELHSMELSLEGMAQAPPYTNYKIGDQTILMQKQIKKLDESRRAIFNIVRAEGETLIKEERKGKGH